MQITRGILIKQLIKGIRQGSLGATLLANYRKIWGLISGGVSYIPAQNLVGLGFSFALSILNSLPRPSK